MTEQDNNRAYSVRMKLKLPLTALVFAATLAAHAQTSLLVLSKRDQTVAIVDPQTLAVRAKAPVGNDPHEVIASADGRTAYVSNYGSGALHTLAVIDLVHDKAEPSIDLGPLTGPHGLDFVDGKLWFTAEGAKAIGSLDPATHKVDLILGTGQNRTHMLIVAPGSEHIITSNVVSGTMTFLDTKPFAAPPAAKFSSSAARPRMDWNETVVPVGPGSEGFDVSPDGKEVWVANAGDGTISVIDSSARKVAATLPAQVNGANRLKFTPDGNFVLVTTLSGPDLMIFDTHTRKLAHRITIGTGAAGLLVMPDGKRAFASCTPDDYVAVIDLTSFKMVGKINAGGNPDGLALTVRR